MDLVSKLKADLAKGFSKIQLEKCIGLPQNSLSGIIAGTKEISKISALKIEQWEKSEKPNPLSLAVPKKRKVALQNLNKSTNQVEEKKPAGSDESNYVIDTSKFDKNDPLKLMQFASDIEKGSALDGFVQQLHKENKPPVSQRENISAIAGETVTVKLVPPIPVKSDFKNSIDFAAAKSEWKVKYGQK